MISSLLIDGFKSITHFDSTFKKLTLLSGINSSGKSTVIQALRMLDNAQNNKKIYLDDFGPYKELQFQPQTHTSKERKRESIFIQATYKDEHNTNKYSLKINEDSIDKSKNKIDTCFQYIGADRFGPQIHLPISYDHTKDINIGEKGEFTIDCLHKYCETIIPRNLVSQDSRGVTLAFNTEAWLNLVSPGYKISTASMQKQDLSAATFNNFRPHNVGFGLSYTLPIIVGLLCFSSVQLTRDTDYTIAIENPEAHLHPKGQTEIGRMIALAAAAGLQVIVETHSDYILDGIRLAIMEKQLRHDDATFLFFELDNNRETVVKEITSNEKGKLSGWPAGFFDQSRTNKAKLAGF